MPTPTFAVATLFDSGLAAITNAVTSRLPIDIHSFELGGAAAVDVPSDTNSGLPVTIYTGDTSRVLVEQENGLATFNIILDETIGDFFVGNLALKITDPVTEQTVPLAVIMFPETIVKIASEANGGAVGETGNYYLVKLVVKLSTLQAIATVTLSNTVYASLPTVDSIQALADPITTPYPHQLLLQTPEVGNPALIARRAGDGLWWGFPFSWSAESYNFGVLSGGYQGDAYLDGGEEPIFGGYFHTTADEFDEEISGGTAWANSSNANLINGGSWS